MQIKMTKKILTTLSIKNKINITDYYFPYQTGKDGKSSTPGKYVFFPVKISGYPF
jgi:hypothetical protein